MRLTLLNTGYQYLYNETNPAKYWLSISIYNETNPAKYWLSISIYNETNPAKYWFT